MKPKMNLKDRYTKENNFSALVEFPKSISKERVLSIAWTWFEGNGANRIPIFADALRESWKSEKDMIKAGGAIYKPYIMSQVCPLM